MGTVLTELTFDEHWVDVRDVRSNTSFRVAAMCDGTMQLQYYGQVVDGESLPVRMSTNTALAIAAAVQGLAEKVRRVEGVGVSHA